MQAEKNWYVISIKEHWEKKITEVLNRKKIEFYYPLTKSLKYHGDKTLSFKYLPLFEHLLFINILESDIPLIKQTDGVHHFLYWLNSYAIINKEDIDTIKVFLYLHNDVWFEKAGVQCDNNITINLDGYIIREKTARIFLPTLGYYLLAETQPEKRKEILQYAN